MKNALDRFNQSLGKEGMDLVVPKKEKGVALGQRSPQPCVVLFDAYQPHMKFGL